MKALAGIVAALVLLVAPSQRRQTKLPVGEAGTACGVRGSAARWSSSSHTAPRKPRTIAGRVVTIDCPVLEPRGRPPRAGTGGLDPISGKGAARRARNDTCAEARPEVRRAGPPRAGTTAWSRLRPSGATAATPQSPGRVVPLTQTGAVYLDEEAKARTLVEVLIGASLVGERRQLSGWPTYALLRDWGFRKLGDRFVSLANPTDTPPAGLSATTATATSTSSLRSFPPLVGGCSSRTMVTR